MNTDHKSISHHGLIGNGKTAALIDSIGSINWCCFPRFDSPSFFAAILDSDMGGSFSLSPCSDFQSRQSYIPETNVLQTTFEEKNGKVNLIDLFPVQSEEASHNKLSAPDEILRILECTEGSLELEMVFKPRPQYGHHQLKIKKAGAFGLRCDLGHELLLLQHQLPTDKIIINEDNGEARAKFTISSGQKLIFSLIYSREAPAVIPPLGEYAFSRLQNTVDYWRNWIAKCEYQGKYASHVKRSALTLKLMIFAPSGAIIAAPTTSLPEEMGGERNWDYRYCWLRDASFTIRALLDLGLQEEADAYMGWILHSTALSRPRLKVLYTVFGETKVPEKILPWLKGHKNSRPVRIGNAADKQFQLDIYGEVIQAIYIYSKHRDGFDRDTVKFLLDLGKSVCELWDAPDDGIWEIRNGPFHHTHSKAMAWIALDRLISLIETHKWKAPLEKFKETARQIKMNLEKEGFNEELGHYTKYYGSRELDASLLMMPIMDYDSESLTRMKNTVIKIKEHLSKNQVVFRYGPGKDGLNGEEGAFGACSFWLVEALAKLRFTSEAETLFKSLIARRNSLDLWPEELGPTENQFLGNYPQAFTHTAIISAALALKESTQ